LTQTRCSSSAQHMCHGFIDIIGSPTHTQLIGHKTYFDDEWLRRRMKHNTVYLTESHFYRLKTVQGNNCNFLLHPFYKYNVLNHGCL
jgi:hypothetical protein